MWHLEGRNQKAGIMMLVIFNLSGSCGQHRAWDRLGSQEMLADKSDA